MAKRLLFRSPDFYRVIETPSTHRDKFHFVQPRWRIRGIELAVNIRSLSGIFAPRLQDVHHVQEVRACVFCFFNDDDYQTRLLSASILFFLYISAHEKIRSKLTAKCLSRYTDLK